MHRKSKTNSVHLQYFGLCPWPVARPRLELKTYLGQIQMQTLAMRQAKSQFAANATSSSRGTCDWWSAVPTWKLYGVFYKLCKHIYIYVLYIYVQYVYIYIYMINTYYIEHDMHTYIYNLRKDTNNCPFARFLPLGRISCEGAGNGHFLTPVVNFGFRTFWADFALLCVKMCRFFWAEMPGKRAEIPGQTQHDLKMKT